MNDVPYYNLMSCTENRIIQKENVFLFYCNIQDCCLPLNLFGLYWIFLQELFSNSSVLYSDIFQIVLFLEIFIKHCKLFLTYDCILCINTIISNNPVLSFRKLNMKRKQYWIIFYFYYDFLQMKLRLSVFHECLRTRNKMLSNFLKFHNFLQLWH